jgi:beta-N-acetylhexosaminidase
MINISDLTLKEKIAQMILVNNTTIKNYSKTPIGGILFGKLSSKKEYKKQINQLQKQSKIPLFIATDLEGYWNPFSNFYKCKSFGDIENEKQAQKLGEEHGKILKELGFNLDFSPVVEPSHKNTAWPGRSFSGTEKQINDKIKNYIKGLHKSKILATAKHYPGGSMKKDPHIFKVKAKISEEDLRYFKNAIKNNIDAIMIGHPIVHGIINSNKKPSTVSPEVINNLKDFEGLIISDAISMWGLRLSYLFKFNQIYVDLINAGNDLIIDTKLWFSPLSNSEKKVNEKIDYVIKATEKGEISEKRIDKSVKKILEAKGYKVTS